jgi:hypothetical protein
MIVGKIGPRVYLPSTSKAPNINRMLSSKVTPGLYRDVILPLSWSWNQWVFFIGVLKLGRLILPTNASQSTQPSV